MAAGKVKLYDKAKLYALNGTHDLDDTTNWKVALFLSTSNANTLTHSPANFAALTNEHSAANGYTAGGFALSGVTLTESGGTVTFDASDYAPYATASGGSITARFGVIYRDATVNGVTKPLFGVFLLDSTPADVTTTTGNTLSITWNASGLATLSGAATD